jgi:hypothetical protein
MILKQGDLWSRLGGHHRGGLNAILVSTNATVRKDGHLVMGRGAALEATKIWPDLPFFLGSIIKDRPEYGVVFAPGVYPMQKWGVLMGAFQVKYHWSNDATLDLISTSTKKLSVIAEAIPHMLFSMNYPGIGNGRLERIDVSQIIKYLPDNVEVWER